MSPIGRPHDPAGVPGTGQRPIPRHRSQAGEPDAAPPAEQADGGAAPAAGPGTSQPPPDTAEAAAGDEPTSPEAGPEQPFAPGQASDDPVAPPTDELAQELATVRAERDQYLELARAKQAELENFRKQVTKRQADHLQQAAADLVNKLLPVLDALDNGVGHGDESLVPVRTQLLAVLEKDGLRRVQPDDAPFDPNEHDAVAHEPGEGGEVTVAETLRAGYWWNGRLLRPAMVRVRG